MFLMIAAVGAASAWMMARAGRWIPARARGLRHPAVAWTYTLPVWILLSLAMTWLAPAAAYLWTLPLLAAGIVLVMAPTRSEAAVRAASVVVLAVAGTLWMRDTINLLHFMVALLGRMPFVTPVYAYPALIAAAGLMVVPPFLAAAASPAPLLRPSLATGLALAAVAGTSIAAWLAPAYTYEQPLRRYARVIQEPGATNAVWQVGSLEPGLDLGEGAPGGWTTAAPEVTSIPWGRMPQPFVFSTVAGPLGPAPASVAGYSALPIEGANGTTPSRHGAPEGTVRVRLIRPPSRHRPGPEQPAWRAALGTLDRDVRGAATRRHRLGGHLRARDAAAARRDARCGHDQRRPRRIGLAAPPGLDAPGPHGLDRLGDLGDRPVRAAAA